MTKCFLSPKRHLFKRSEMIYGHFLEHFHRQVYGGVFEPGSPLADEDGFRQDVIQALRDIQTPIIRWPGGCFVSDYHWQDGVGKSRSPVYNKAWRVEESNLFGTDEYIAFCNKVGCQPYICTNAGTGTSEEMGDWVEYCNLENQGRFARERISNGHTTPYQVPYWSVGNENYGHWEIGAKDAKEWGRYVRESAKMMRRVDPTIHLSAAALPDLDWNLELLRCAGQYLEYISIHRYWDSLGQENTPADYEACMAYTNDLDTSIRQVRGLLQATGHTHIRIAFDEWNLRSWHHPNIMDFYQGRTEAEYLTPRGKNDDNATYTMADAVFSACFLNTLLRNADIVGMANFAPVINTRGALFIHPEGVVKRTTYHVFALYTQLMGDTIIDTWSPDIPFYEVCDKAGDIVSVDSLDMVAAIDSKTGMLTMSVVNKHASCDQELLIHVGGEYCAESVHVLSGPDKDAYNDIDHPKRVCPHLDDGRMIQLPVQGDYKIMVPGCSVVIIRWTPL